MWAHRRAVIGAGLVAAALACGSEPRADRGAGETTTGGSGLSRQQALDSARAFMARSSGASQVYLDSSEVQRVDSIWRVTFRRRALIIPNVVTVDVHATTGAMRFPGDE